MLWFACGLLPYAVAQEAPLAPDDRFLADLAEGDGDQPVDRARLAEMLANVASTLDREKAKIGTLQQLVRVPEPARENVRLMLESRYEEYAESVSKFALTAALLVDEPNSRLRLYRASTNGQRTCWTLDLYHQLLGTWNGGGPEMRAMLPSRVACGRFRTAVFQPRVSAILDDALVEQVYQRDEIRRLTEDLRDLQELVDDLAEIDAAD